MAEVILARIIRQLATVRARDGAVREFEALQDIVTALTVRSLVTSGDFNWTRFYDWYIERLYALQEELVEQMTVTEAAAFRGKSKDDIRAAITRIRAILNLLPETSQVLQAAAKQ